MSSLALRFSKFLRCASPSTTNHSLGVGVQRSLRFWYSSTTFNSEGGDEKNEGEVDDDEVELEDVIGGKPDLHLQGVDPKRGWGFRGVHKAIICGKVGQAPVQKILRNGRSVTIFTVGTGGMFDQRAAFGPQPKPAQWHRIAVHNEMLGNYAVQKLAKNSSVYVEGDIETRVYNDSITGVVKNIPEICIRRNGKIRLIRSGESINDINFDDLREGLLS